MELGTLLLILGGGYLLYNALKTPSAPGAPQMPQHIYPPQPISTAVAGPSIPVLTPSTPKPGPTQTPTGESAFTTTAPIVSPPPAYIPPPSVAAPIITEPLKTYTSPAQVNMTPQLPMAPSYVPPPVSIISQNVQAMINAGYSQEAIDASVQQQLTGSSTKMAVAMVNLDNGQIVPLYPGQSPPPNFVSLYPTAPESYHESAMATVVPSVPVTDEQRNYYSSLGIKI